MLTHEERKVAERFKRDTQYIHNIEALINKIKNTHQSVGYLGFELQVALAPHWKRWLTRHYALFRNKTKLQEWMDNGQRFPYHEPLEETQHLTIHSPAAVPLPQQTDYSQILQRDCPSPNFQLYQIYENHQNEHSSSSVPSPMTNLSCDENV